MLKLLILKDNEEYDEAIISEEDYEQICDFLVKNEKKSGKLYNIFN